MLSKDEIKANKKILDGYAKEARRCKSNPIDYEDIYLSDGEYVDYFCYHYIMSGDLDNIRICNCEYSDCSCAIDYIYERNDKVRKANRKRFETLIKNGNTNYHIENGMIYFKQK